MWANIFIKILINTDSPSPRRMYRMTLVIIFYTKFIIQIYGPCANTHQKSCYISRACTEYSENLERDFPLQSLVLIFVILLHGILPAVCTQSLSIGVCTCNATSIRQTASSSRVASPRDFCICSYVHPKYIFNVAPTIQQLARKSLCTTELPLQLKIFSIRIFRIL